MKKLLLLFLLVAALAVRCDSDIEENEFAEFEDEEIEAPHSQPAAARADAPRTPETVTPKKAHVEDDFDDDYGVVEDEHEEGDLEGIPKDSDISGEGAKPQTLKFTDVPAHFRSNWASYQVEALILVVIVVYLLTYAVGRTANYSIATTWFENNKEILDQQFALVGDDGISEQPNAEHLQQDTDCSFGVWCSGRVGVNSMLAQIKTIKRQDLVSRVMGFFTPQNDRIIFKLELEAGDFDSFVLAVGQKKIVNKLYKEMMDLSTFTTEKKNMAAYNLPPSFVLYSEQAEATYALFDNNVAAILKRHEKAIECIHISDQFSGPKPPEGETYTRLPEVVRLVQLSFNLSECTQKEAQQELLQLLFYIVEKVRKLRLSKEAKAKADKKRREIEEAFLKTTHQLRQEAAQARREEKTRERKQKMLEEEDPEKQRRLEKMELKREAKAKQPKMKQLKMKM